MKDRQVQYQKAMERLEMLPWGDDRADAIRAYVAELEELAGAKDKRVVELLGYVAELEASMHKQGSKLGVHIGALEIARQTIERVEAERDALKSRLDNIEVTR